MGMLGERPVWALAAWTKLHALVLTLEYGYGSFRCRESPEEVAGS